MAGYQNISILEINDKKFIKLDVIEGEDGSPRWAAYVAGGRTATVKLTADITVQLKDIEIVQYPRQTVVMAEIADFGADVHAASRILKYISVGEIQAIVSDNGLRAVYYDQYVRSLQSEHPNLDLVGYDNIWVAAKAGLL